jgi:hypothetical protein
LDVGGLYQITQLCFSGHGEPVSTAGALRADSAAAELAAALADVEEVFPTGFLSFLSIGTEGEGTPPAALLKSKAVPGVLGVFVADPNDAKAPDPRPKADDAPPPGEDTLVVVSGAMLLKGFARPPCELRPPSWRLDEEYARGEEFSFRDSWFSPLVVEREILLELWNPHISHWMQG